MAAHYDELWTRTTIGRLQREAVWRHLDVWFHPGETSLDLGCGTGEDALHLMNSGIQVQGIDESSEMVRLTRARGIDATQSTIEEIERIPGSFDGVF